MAMPRKKVNDGQKFGYWSVIREIPTKSYDGVTMRRFLVRCVCKTESIVTLNNLLRGRSTNCGCKSPYHKGK